MSYTRPAGNAVNFTDFTAGYTRPSGGSVVFNFQTVPGVSGVGVATITPEAVGTGEHFAAISGSGAADVSVSSAGAGEHLSPVSGSGVADVSVSSAGVGEHLSSVSGSGAADVSVSSAGVGEHAANITGTGAADVVITASGSGIFSSLEPVTGTGSAAIPFSALGNGQHTSPTLNGYDFVYNVQSWSVNPSDVYIQWAIDLGVSPFGTDADFGADDEAFRLTSAVSFIPGGSNEFFYATEGGIGFYKVTPPVNNVEGYSYIPLDNVYRLRGLQTRPPILITFRHEYNEGTDLKSYDTKIRSVGSTTIIFARHSDYGDESAERFDIAIKLVNNTIELVTRNFDLPFECRITRLEEGITSTTVLNQKLLYSVPGLLTGSTLNRLTGTLAVIPNAYVDVPSILGSPEIVSYVGGVGPRQAKIQLDTILGPISSLGYVDIKGFISDTNLLGPIAAVAEYTVVARAAVPSILAFPVNGTGYQLVAQYQGPTAYGDFKAVAWHDFTGSLGDLTIYYIADLVNSAGVKTRVPISSWQATLKVGGSNYVQCVVPAVSSYVAAIESATQFIIYRKGVSSDGSFYETEMTKAPINTLSLDQGPNRYTATISGYSPGFAANENPSQGLDRRLEDVRSISISNSQFRVRCGIDWLLRPATRALVRDQNFIVSYINYYVNLDDSYMDVGES